VTQTESINIHNKEIDMYRVGDNVFNTFDDVITWAWAVHLIDLYREPQTELEKHAACKELEDHIGSD
jgi:hypothetical protein